MRAKVRMIAGTALLAGTLLVGTSLRVDATPPATRSGTVGIRSDVRAEASDGVVRVPTDAVDGLGRVPNIVCEPDPLYLTTVDPDGTVEVVCEGGAGAVYSYSMRFTWDSAVAHTSPDSVEQGDLLEGTGASTFFFARNAGAANEIIIDCSILGPHEGVDGSGTMFTIDFALVDAGASVVDISIEHIRDNANQDLAGFSEDDGQIIAGDAIPPTVTDVHVANLTLTHTDDYIKDGDGFQVTALVTDDDPTFGAEHITADLSGLGGGAAENPGTYAAGTATWTFGPAVCTPSDGVVSVTVGAIDPAGAPASPATDDIITDNTPPTAVTGFDAYPGHELCELTWTNGNDDHLAGVVVARLGEPVGDPFYSTFASSWPDVDDLFPSNASQGAQIYDGTGSASTDEVAERNIYFYQAFCYDEARNVGPAGEGARDYSTNYLLADVADGINSWGGDGSVDFEDLMMFSLYFGATAPGLPEAACDFGPTVNPAYQGYGVPVPDGAIAFDDLMILSLNFGMPRSAPASVPLLPDPPDGPLALSLAPLGTNSAGDVEIALRLTGNIDEVKGLSAVVAYEPIRLEFVRARTSDTMRVAVADIFFWHGAGDGTVEIDLAVLGRGLTIGGSGELAVLTFRALSGGRSPRIVSADVRDGSNARLDVELVDGTEPASGPASFGLTRNVPNPFNPVTNIGYLVPRAAVVTIRVHDVAGRLVRTLVDREVEAGRHAVRWDGTNERGEAVGSGVYLCSMEAGGFHASRKMLLLK